MNLSKTDGFCNPRKLQRVVIELNLWPLIGWVDDGIGAGLPNLCCTRARYRSPARRLGSPGLGYQESHVMAMRLNNWRKSHSSM